MRRLGKTHQEIADFFIINLNGVRYTCRTGQDTPQHNKAGRPPRLSEEEIDQLIEYMRTNVVTRRVTYRELGETCFPEKPVGVEAIKYALNK